MPNLNDWENHHILQINREPMHVPWGAYENEEQAAVCDRNASHFCMLLDGTWKFRLYDNPNEVPEEFGRADFDISGWEDISVPGNWELQGHGCPIYTNVKYPFSMEDPDSPHIIRPHLGSDDGGHGVYLNLRPPFVPSDNPTGCYARDFVLPDSYENRSVYINFDGVESCFYLWINGVKVGYSQDSKLCAEFEITGYLNKGNNRISVQVMRWCDGSYLEDQDYWHISGIYRSVKLYAKPYIHITDFKVVTTLDDSYTDGKLTAYCYVNKLDGFADYKVKMRLLDAHGRDVINPQVSNISKDTPMYMRAENIPESGAALFTASVPHPAKWSAENPNLYTILFTLISPDGCAADFESCRTGFRRIEISKDGVILLNGRRLVIRGADRHEHHPDTGRTISTGRMRDEIIAMKRLNFNAVRTSHYPNDPRWYDLCDELGIYLVDETNLETHGIQGMLSKDPGWAPAYLDRAVRMVMRDKNHPSIIFWSLGNESSAGPNHAAMAGWIRFYDPTRPVQYESGDPGKLISDIRVPMYPSLDWVAEVMADMNDKRPMVMCEYAYSKSNSNGNFKDFWDAVDKYPRFQGGFVWDWADKALTRKLPDGTKHWAYGGDFGEPVVDPVLDMCLNGVVLPDLTPKPGAFEIKNIQAPVRIKPVDLNTGRILMENRYLDSTLEHLYLIWEIVENGLPVESGKIDCLAAKAGDVEEIVLPVNFDCRFGGSEYFLNLYVKIKSGLPWAPADHEIYRAQFSLQTVQKNTGENRINGCSLYIPDNKTAKELKLAETESDYLITGESFSLRFNKKDGLISEYKVDNKTLLDMAARENYYRAPTGIDEGQGDPNSFAYEWREDGLDRLERCVNKCSAVSVGHSSVLIEANVLLFADKKFSGIESKIRYMINKDGVIEVTNWVSVSNVIRTLPRIGLTLTAPGEYETLTWYGRGPHENYMDRKHSALIGLYQSTVDEQHFPYILPVECGGKEDVRWFALRNSEGAGFMAAGFGLLHFDVHRSSVAGYGTAKHDFELVPENRVYVNIDCRHAGLGGDSGWNKTIHPQYQVKPGKYLYQFAISPLKGSDNMHDTYKKIMGVD